MRTRKHKPNIAHILTLSLIGMMLAQSLYANSPYGSDSVLELSRTGGYASLSDADVDDLDYSKDFSVEVITKIEPHSIGGQLTSFIQKSWKGALFSASEPGFAIWPNPGHFEYFGQRLSAKVGDGTNHVFLTSQTLEGCVYAVMTWDSTAKELILYINGAEDVNGTNPAINPLNIENNYDLQVGRIGSDLKRDIFMIRVWNRGLSSSEVSNLWNNYDTTGQHILPSGFSNTELKSEWLMQQTSDAEGNSGTTHIKDTKGTNHLELKDGAEISTAIGYLTVESPLNNATDVDKAVILRVSGGILDLEPLTRPLHYYFQVDESLDFNSSWLKESGWVVHYGRYKPILKPNTQYYWRVKVKDSSSTPVESAYTSTQSFTTEGPTDWYVRPGVYSGVSAVIPIPVPGTYGNQDGTSYDDAWNGIREIDWGEDGVEAGDNLYVCGEHVYNTTSDDYISYQAIEYIRESGFSEEYPITIRMDCIEEPGTLYGIWMDNHVNVVWNGPDENDVYWTDNLQYGAVAEFNGTDYIWLDEENSTTWEEHYGATFANGSIDYVKTTDGSNPTGKIYSSNMGFRFDLGRSKYIKFYNGNFYGSIIGKERIGKTNTNIPVSTHIVFDSCKMIYGITNWLYAGHDYWIFRNNDISYAGNGIYTNSLDTGLNPTRWGASYLLIENNTFKHLGVPGFYHQDAHAVGIQGGRENIIQGNYIEDTGTSIEFHTGYWKMKNMTIRNNFIKNTRAEGGGGGGIAVSGTNMDSIGRRTGFKIYNNIVMNTGIGTTEAWQGTGISTNNKDPVEIYNNIIINPAGRAIRFGIMDAPPQGAVYNNIIVNPGSYYLHIWSSVPGDWSNFSCDYNLYYPATDFTFTTGFYFAQAIDSDNNSILADPMFVSSDPQEPADFKLQAGSPAIDAGVDVDLTQDFEGNPVPQGPAFDIGAYECVLDPDNPTPELQSIGNKSVNENSALTFDINATDPDSEPITYAVQSLPSGATFSIQTFSWTPSYDQADSYQVRFIASDGNSNDSETITITVNNVNRAPVLGAIADQSVNENTLLSFLVNATDPDGQTLAYSVSGLPTGAVFASQTFTWTPSYDQAGNYQVTFTADDGQAQDSETITITVINVNRAPVLTAISNRTAYADVLLTFTIDATDPDGDAITYSAGTLPSGATFTGQDFNWTPSQSQVGSYTVTFVATDGQLQDSETVTMTVDVDNLAPTVIDLSPAAGSIQVPLNNLITLNVTDAGIGVEAKSVKIKVRVNDNPNNYTVYFGDTGHYTSPEGDCRRLGTKADYRFVYQSTSEMFYYDQTVTITVNATDLAGNVMNEYSYSFATEMHSFGQNKQVNSGLDNSDRPVTVYDSSGNIWTAWHAGSVGNRDIYVSKLAAGEENFSGTVQLTDNMTDQCNPAVALDSNDKLYVVWQDNRQGDWDIYVSTSVDGISWSTETRVNDPNEDNQVNPAIVIDGQSPNYAHVVWQDDRAGNQDIFIATSSNGFATPTVSQQITFDNFDQVEPAIAADSDNTIYVVWTDGRNGSNDIYGAASNNPWTNVAIVSNANNQSSPAIATESAGSILHLLWVDDTSGDNDIYYASSNGLPGSPLTGSSIIDDSSGADQLDPTIAVTGSTDNNLKVFACWQDWRNTDTDLYFAELSSGSGTNVFVDEGGSNAYQGEPAVGIGEYGHPYIMWADSRSTNTDIYYAGSTFVEPVALASELVTASAPSSTIVGTDPQAITTVDDVSIVVPAGACSYDVAITVSKIANLPAFAAPCLGGYDFGPSGIQFSQPVTITIPYVNVSGSATLYWFNSLTGALSQQGITDIQDIPISSSLHALSFKTTHFTAFYLFVGGGTTAAIVSGGGGGGGCSVSASGEGNIVEYILPYIVLAVVMAILKMRDARDRKGT